jgi:hypothetical protein
MVGQKPLRLPDGFEARLRAFRDHDARELPEAGLWHRAKLTLDAEGTLTVSRSYLDEPRAPLTLDDEGLRRDAAALPRIPYWTPGWLARRLGE